MLVDHAQVGLDRGDEVGDAGNASRLRFLWVAWLSRISCTAGPLTIGRDGWVRSSAWIWLLSSVQSTTALSVGLRADLVRRRVSSVIEFSSRSDAVEVSGPIDHDLELLVVWCLGSGTLDEGSADDPNVVRAGAK